MNRSVCRLPVPGQRPVLPLFFCIALLVVLHSSQALASTHQAETFLRDLPRYEVVHPTRVDARGHFLSHFLSHQARRVRRREAPEEQADPDRVFYQLWHDGRSLYFNLTVNPQLLAPSFLIERRYGGLEGARIHPPRSPLCHFLGNVLDEATVRGSAAISTCDGLTGLFKLSDEEFFIQPLESSRDDPSAPQPHAIYKRHASPSPRSPVTPTHSGKHTLNGTCGVKDFHQSSEDVERQRERWEHRQQRKRSRVRQRSVSREKWVETLVVADSKMVDYHGSKAVESYVLAVMNIVAGLFKDASIGNAINVVVVRLILLEEDEEDLKITHHADNSLSSFCKWQKKLNMKGDEHPLHHDVAVLLTRKDICTAINAPCETLGLSHVAGMCQPHRSCSISEDTGLPLAFTVAHEMGHNFGIQHDGNGNDCEPIGKRPFVMSPQLLYGTALPRWSRCSRQYITRFLDRGWGSCLDDPPAKDRLSLTSVPPGVLYSAVHQCRLQYGSKSLLCDDMDNVCSTLWCTVGTTCHSKLDGAVDGTSCGENKWCFSGECVAVGFQPESVNGGWGSWGEWSACSRTCGAGVRSAERDCDRPVPKYRGRYCLGERRRYKICHSTPCPPDLPSFRDLQCRHFNTLPYKGQFYKWESVINRVNPCELHCRPLNEHFSEKMRDAVTDGTPCYQGNKSRDMCINGICKKIGCDYVIDSTAVEDRCGVCHGNGSTCTTVRRTFEESEGHGYVDIGLIPEGAWDIRIEEMADAGNYLALRSDNPSTYFLNGGWTIQWNGEYKAAGTVFTYQRNGHMENLTSPGPTMEPLWIQLLFQEINPGVRYEYTISRNVSGDDSIPIHFWKYGSWTECSVTCGTGVQRQIIHCVEKTTGIVEGHYCDPLTRPDHNQTSCNKDPCPAIWWVGEWQRCSASCGSTGQTKRPVLCVRAIGGEEQKALEPSDCEHIPKPESVSSCNTHIPCPADWTTSSWSKCSLTCGSGVRHRNVTCSRNTGVDCDPLQKPLVVSSCHVQDCPLIVDNFGSIEVSGSGWSSKEVLNEIKPITEFRPPPKHGTTRAQPRSSNNLNQVVEGDFDYHNNIENIQTSQENNVQVDDFYYDYNFINFHEDLSDDFDSNDSEYSHSVDAPRAVKPTTSVKEKASIETTRPPAVSSQTISTSLEPEKPKNMSVHNMNDNGYVAIKEVNSDNVFDFLSEDHLLPVVTTRSPFLPPARHSHKDKHANPQEPENVNAVPHLVLTSKEHVEWGQDGEETEKRFDKFTEDDNYTEDVTASPKHASPRHLTTASISPTTDSQGIEEEYVYKSQEDDENPGFLDSESKIQVEIEAGLDEKALEIPHTPRPASTISPAAFTFEYLEIDSSPTNDLFTSSESNSWNYNPTTSLPASEGPLSIPFLLISGNEETLDGSESTTGTESIPPTNLEDATQPPPVLFLPVPKQHTAFNEPTGTHSTPQPPLYDLPDVDYNEIVITPVQRSNSPPLNRFPVSTGDNSQHTTSLSISPTPPPVWWSDPIQYSASTQVTTASYWIAGNWSTCSTSCGLGAIWRTLTCSTGVDQDCDPAEKPAPAQRCYLRPCSTWNIGEWSKCSKNCDGGIKSREVQCFDLRDQRPLRPFHCRAMSSKPQTQMPCNPQACQEWYTSSWGQCSEVCGGGEQQRIVTCPEDNRCDRDRHPTAIQPCNTQPCAQWLTGSWGECSAPCGGGVQQRLIKCVDTKTETDQEVDQSRCDHQPQPESTRKCNIQKCKSAPSGALCLRDRLTSRFCQTLRWLGRCLLPNVRAQCCKTCGSRSGRTSTRRGAAQKKPTMD